VSRLVRRRLRGSSAATGRELARLDEWRTQLWLVEVRVLVLLAPLLRTTRGAVARLGLGLGGVRHAKASSRRGRAKGTAKNSRERWTRSWVTGGARRRGREGSVKSAAGLHQMRRMSATLATPPPHANRINPEI
jgi:hypothetical protein